jgi:imidazoleglycerol phosphate dehydratase HisB
MVPLYDKRKNKNFFKKYSKKIIKQDKKINKVTIQTAGRPYFFFEENDESSDKKDV